MTTTNKVNKNNLAPDGSDVYIKTIGSLICIFIFGVKYYVTTDTTRLNEIIYNFRKNEKSIYIENIA